MALRRPNPSLDWLKINPDAELDKLQWARRLLEAVGLERRPKDVTPSVDAYLEHLNRVAPKPALEIPGKPAGGGSASGWEDAP